MVLAVIFGGGGARGAFAAGAWSVLGPHLQPDFVIGSSIGAINALGTTRLTPQELLAWWRNRAPRWVTPQIGGAPAFAPLIDELVALPVRSPWPALAACTRLPDRRLTVRMLTGRHTATWLLASAALPGWLRPVRVDGRRYVDGGVVNDLPIDVAKDLGATRLIALSAAGLGPVPAVPATLTLTPPARSPGLLDFSGAARERLLLAGIAAGQAALPAVVDICH